MSFSDLHIQVQEEFEALLPELRGRYPQLQEYFFLRELKAKAFLIYESTGDATQDRRRYQEKLEALIEEQAEAWLNKDAGSV